MSLKRYMVRLHLNILSGSNLSANGSVEFSHFRYERKDAMYCYFGMEAGKLLQPSRIIFLVSRTDLVMKKFSVTLERH